MKQFYQKPEQTQAWIDALQSEQATNLENEAEIQRLKIFLKNYQTDFENAKKEVTALEKQVKNKEKVQTKVDRLRERLTEKESERNVMEKRLNSTKPLDDLKEHESELQHQNKEDRAVIQDENTSPSEREAAETCVAERNEELVCLQTQIEERERALPLGERIREIFKKYGLTVTAILLAAGITIRAVVGMVTNALKATGKAFGAGLKEIGTKLGSLLPGLISQVVSFLFKTAGQVVGYLAEHTWLLILAAVFFIFEKYIKKQA